MKKFISILVFLFLVGSIVFAEETIQTTQSSTPKWYTANDYVTATSSNAGASFTFKEGTATEGGSVDIGEGVNRHTYAYAQKDSYINTDKNGKIVNAELTAAKDTTWVFDKVEYKVPTGAKLAYAEGKVTLELPANSKMNVKNGNIDYTLENVLNEKVSLSGDTVTGNNFKMDGIVCSGISSNNPCSVTSLGGDFYRVGVGGRTSVGKTTFQSEKGDLYLQKNENPVNARFSQIESNQVSTDKTGDNWVARSGPNEGLSLSSDAVKLSFQKGAYGSYIDGKLDVHQGPSGAYNYQDIISGQDDETFLSRIISTKINGNFDGKWVDSTFRQSNSGELESVKLFSVLPKPLDNFLDKNMHGDIRAQVVMGKEGVEGAQLVYIVKM